MRSQMRHAAEYCRNFTKDDADYMVLKMLF